MKTEQQIMERLNRLNILLTMGDEASFKSIQLNNWRKEAHILRWILDMPSLLNENIGGNTKIPRGSNQEEKVQKLLEINKDKELCIGDIAAELDIQYASAMKVLQNLESAGKVTYRRDGRIKLWRINK